MPIRAVITDFGGVLYFLPDARWLRRWQTLLGLKNDPLVNQMFASGMESDLARRVFTGEIPEEEVWRRASKVWHLHPRLLRWLQRRSFSKERFNRPMADFIRSLRPAYRTAILTNAGDQGRQVFGAIYHLEDLVDTVIVSAEEGLAKPDERLYRLALKRIGVAPEETLFIDDLATNVEAARRVGMRAIQFQTTAQTIGEIKSVLN
jgi:epoxide hydrolase-like predicted phosphatase